MIWGEVRQGGRGSRDVGLTAVVGILRWGRLCLFRSLECWCSTALDCCSLGFPWSHLIVFLFFIFGYLFFLVLSMYPKQPVLVQLL
jgi:hypothetical protein